MKNFAPCKEKSLSPIQNAFGREKPFFARDKTRLGGGLLGIDLQRISRYRPSTQAPRFLLSQQSQKKNGGGDTQDCPRIGCGCGDQLLSPGTRQALA